MKAILTLRVGVRANWRRLQGFKQDHGKTMSSREGFEKAKARAKLAAWALVLALGLSGLREVRAQGQITFADPGFAAETVVSLPPYTPVGLAFAPDGRIFIWQKSGVVRVFRNGELLPTPFIDIQAQVNQVQDRGLLGLALDPNFSANGYVYLLYTFEDAGNPNDPGPKTARLTRVTADPSANFDVALPGSEIVLLGSLGTPPCDAYPPGSDCIPDDWISHTIGTVRFAPDGNMFVGNGDGASANFADPLSLRAQGLNNYSGKILRIKPDGSAPGDNPFDDGTNAIRSKVWAYGLRNPFRFGLHPTTGEPYIGDVGWNSWEEVNRGRGANFGWPCYEGNDPQPDFQSAFELCQQLPASEVTPPLYTYDHSEGGAAVIGGNFYNATVYSSQYQGNFFFADYVRQWIRRLVFDADGNLLSVVPFATNIPGPVAIELGPDGMLYYVAFLTGEVGRIRYAGPGARVSASPTSGYSPLNVSFSSAGSEDPAGGGLSYLWDFGDGVTSTDPNPVHTYVADGVMTFAAKLTVTDINGISSSATLRITLGSLPPVATILTPADGTHVRPGDTVIYQGSATDPDDGPLPPNALSWTILLHHNSHVHTFVGGTGSSGSFVVQNHDATATYSYEVVLTATDSSGLTDTKSVLLPVDVSVLFSLTLDPSSVVGGASSLGTVTLSAPAPAGGAVVALSISNNTAAATVPASVTVPAGATSATFTVTTSTVTSSTWVTISASYGGATQTASLTVIPAIILSWLTLNPTSVAEVCIGPMERGD